MHFPFRLSTAKRDLLICVIIVAGLFLLAGHYDLLERWNVWSKTHEMWAFDEVVAVLALCSGGFSWFAYRRWRAAKDQLRQILNINREPNKEIEALERVQRKLNESEERFRQATKMAQLGYYIWDAATDRCHYCSDEYASMHGLSPEQFIAQASGLDGEFSLTHPDDRDEVQSAMKALREGVLFEMEYRTIAPDGTARHVREIAHPVFDEEGRVVREIGVCQDITDMKRAETLLARAVDVIPGLFALFDAEDRLVVCNQKYRELYETESAAVVPGVKFETLVRSFAAATGVGDSAADTEDWVERRLDRRNSGTRSQEYRRRDGEWIEVSDHFLEDGSVFTVGMVITERKRVEAELLQSQKMEAVGQLTGGVAHDFNNLLGVIMGNAEILEDEVGQRNLSVQAIFRSAQRGAELTQRLLAFSRRQPLRPSALHPAELVDGMHQLLSRTLGKKIEIDVDIPASLWHVEADPGQLENALLNLALNARDAMPDGGTLRIVLANAPMKTYENAEYVEVTPGDYVSLRVSDTGTGMDKDVLEHVFEPFFTTKDVGKGTGLGLSMVYGFAKQSGGDIHIESSLGHGTTVTIFLPRAGSGSEASYMPAVAVTGATGRQVRQ
ncbi:MAG: PAS domain S-box protein [Alphaproteobacteria bacterium]|nr:PAS domain S-box protein [Alphaproteobacteria bacterium]